MARKEDVEETGIQGIKKRKKDGKYLVTLDLGRENKRDNKTGEVKLRQVKTTKVVSSLREAKHLIAESKRQKKARETTDKHGGYRFDKALEDFLSANKENWSKDYYLLQRSSTKRLNAYFGGMDVHAIETLDVEEFFQWCREGTDGFGPLSDNSITEIKSTLSMMYKWLKRAGYVKTNPVRLAVAKRKPYEAHTIGSEMLSKLVKASFGQDMALAVAVSLAGLGGLRRGEVCGLTWNKIDWENHRIRIDTQRKVGRDGVISASLPKNGTEGTEEQRKERWAALPKPLEHILLRAKAVQESLGHADGTDYVYRTKHDILNNLPPSPRNLSDSFASLRTRLELPPNFRFHDLRHTFISLCLNGGVNYFQVSASVGHSLRANGPTSVRVYWHDDGDRTEINEFIGKIIEVEDEEE